MYSQHLNELQELFRTIVKSYDKLPDTIKNSSMKALGVSQEVLEFSAKLVNKRSITLDEADTAFLGNVIKLLTNKLNYDVYVSLNFKVLQRENVKLEHIKVSMEPLKETEEIVEYTKELSRINLLKKYLDASYLLSLTRSKGFVWRFNLKSAYDALKNRERSLMDILRDRHLSLSLSSLGDYEAFKDKISEIEVMTDKIKSISEIGRVLNITKTSELISLCRRGNWRVFIKFALENVERLGELLYSLTVSRRELSINERFQEFARIVDVSVKGLSEIERVLSEIEKSVKEGIDPLSHIENGYFEWLSRIGIREDSYMKILDEFRRGIRGLSLEMILSIVVLYHVLFHLFLYELLRDPCQINAIFLNKFRNMLEALTLIMNQISSRKPEWYGNKLGISERVPPPFEDVRVKGRTISVWGRFYELGELLLPRRIHTDDTHILAAPMRLICRVSPSGRLMPLSVV